MSRRVVLLLIYLVATVVSLVSTEKETVANFLYLWGQYSSAYLFFFSPLAGLTNVKNLPSPLLRTKHWNFPFTGFEFLDFTDLLLALRWMYRDHVSPYWRIEHVASLARARLLDCFLILLRQGHR